MKNQLLFTILLTILSQVTHAQSLVGLHTGEEIKHNNLRLKSPLFSRQYLLADQEIKYQLDNVRYYQNHDGYFLKWTKRSGNYEFMQREMEGAIEMYSVMRTNTSYDPNMGMHSTTSSKLNFYRKQNGDIKKVNGRNLSLDLAECPECLVEVKKGKTNSTISTVLFTAGMAIFVGTAASMLSKSPEPGESTGIPPGAIIGPVVCLSSMFFKAPIRKHYRNSIALYNNRNK